MFTKEKSKEIKAVAIMLMLFHHLFVLKNRIYIGYNPYTNIIIFGKEIVQSLGSFGKICVSIFMFIIGYALYLDYKTDKTKKDNYLLTKIIKLYKQYWKVFLIFVPIGLLFCRYTVPYTLGNFSYYRFSSLTISNLITDFLGISCYISSEWWFIKAYVLGLIWGIIYLESTKKINNKYIEAILIILIYILFNNILLNIQYIQLFKNITNIIYFKELFLIADTTMLIPVGIYFSKYEIFDKWNKLINGLRKYEKIIISIFLLFLSFFIYQTVYDYQSNLIITPIFIFGILIILDTIKVINKPLAYLGKYTIYMWLTHSFFCYYYKPFSKFIYQGNNAIFSFIKLYIITLIVSIILEYVWKLISKCYNQFRNIKLIRKF